MYDPKDSKDIDWICAPVEELYIRKYGIIKVEDIEKH